MGGVRKYAEVGGAKRPLSAFLLEEEVGQAREGARDGDEGGKRGIGEMMETKLQSGLDNDLLSLKRI